MFIKKRNNTKSQMLGELGTRLKTSKEEQKNNIMGTITGTMS